MDERIFVLSNSSRSSVSDREDLGSPKRKDECIARRYYIGYSFIMFVVATVVIIVVSVSTSTKTVAQKQTFSTNCPPDTFPCQSEQVCINSSLLCDKVLDCKDGSDEGSVCDRDQDKLWSRVYQKAHESENENTNKSEECTLKEKPEACDCREETKLYCGNRTLSTVPSPMTSQVTKLVLSLNNISEITAHQFDNMSHLDELIMDHSYLRTIAPRTFRKAKRITTLQLKFNLLTRFSSDVFWSTNRVQTLDLMGNELTELKKGDFNKMYLLRHLQLSHNKIHTIEDGAFDSLHRLQTLFLSGNALTEIKPYYFSNLRSLIALNLDENRIARIHPHSFINLGSLVSLDLKKNYGIHTLENGVFDGLANLTTLSLTHNSITTIEGKAFRDLVSVRSLSLGENSIRKIENGTFTYMKGLNYIYFDKFYMCLYVSQDIQCEPQGDGISSKQNLLENIILRICVWIVALLACGGNLLVILGRFLMKEDNQIHSFFIKNLSLADLLMGLYLLIIASHDIKFRGQYIMYDESWRNSWECDFSGVLSTLSTEMSVLTLSVITLDRYISIMYPLSFRKRGLKVAYGVMIFAWTVCIVLAALPVMGLEYFGHAFYSDNAVCVPLHLHDPRARGWEYSSFLFLGINFGSFGFIAYAYVAMFYAIHMSALPLRTSRESKERSLVKRFFFIVITDFMCWIPIIIIKIMALGGVTISDDLYAWVIVFALPVNSALNPLLYTLTTNMFKKKLLSKFTVVFRTDKYSNHSLSSMKNNTSVNRQVQDYEMGLLKRYHPNRSTVKTYLSYQASDRRRDDNRCCNNEDDMGNNINTPDILNNCSTSKSLINDMDT